MVDVIQVRKDGITKQIRNSDLKQYQAMGWKLVQDNVSTYGTQPQRIEKII